MKKTHIAVGLILFWIGAVAEGATGSSCGNSTAPGGGGRPIPDSSPMPNPAKGDPVIPYTGNEFRDVNDLQIWGGVGHHQLLWSRHGSSRAVRQSDWFGQGHYWRHNYQWDLTVTVVTSQTNVSSAPTPISSSTTLFVAAAAAGGSTLPPPPTATPTPTTPGVVSSQTNVSIAEPYGNVWSFTAQADGTWKGLATCTAQLTSQGNDFIYQTENGYRYHFAKQVGGAAATWLMTDFSDDIGNVYRLSYDGNGQLIGVSEPGGRSLQIAYKSISLGGTGGSISVIDRVSSSDGRSVQYQYTPFTDAVLQVNYPTLTRVNYGDGTSAAYTYGQIFSGTRPLIIEYDDVRCTTRQQHSHTVYQSGSGAVLGMVDHQVNPATGGTILTLGIVGGDIHSPQVTFANGGTNSQLMRKGLLVTETDANGKSTLYNYDTNGFVSSRSDPLGHVTSYVRNQSGGLLRQTNADGTMESFTRNALNAVTSHTDTLGRVTTWDRDASNRVTAIHYPDGSSEAYSYNGFGQVLTHSLRNGGTESFSYDGRALLLAKTDALGNVTRFGYDSADRLNRVTDARGNTTSMVYNERGLITQMSYPDGSSRTLAYDGRGNLVSESNELGATWSYSYDPTFSLLLSKTDPMGRTTVYGYLPDSPEEQPTQVIAPSGKQIANTYDLDWHLLSTTAGAGSADAATTRFVYDGSYNLIQKIDGNGKSWNYTYDFRNRRILDKSPLSYGTSYAYDGESNLLKLTRPDGKASTNSYDTMNRLVSSTDEAGNTTQYGYDASGNLASLTDAKGNVYSYSYDLLNRRLSMSYPDGTQELWSYDEVGNMSSYTTRAGQTATYSYDSRNRCTGYSWSDGTPTVARTYDVAGRLLSLSNAASVIGYGYDAANEVTSQSQTLAAAPGSTNAPTTQSVSYSYDVDGNRITLNYPDASQVSYQYNGRNLLSSILSGASNGVANFSYDGNGNRFGKALVNGVMTTYLYDAASRLTGTTNSVVGAGSLVAGYTYGLDPVGRRTARVETTTLATKRENYSYDAISQITNVAYASGTKVGYAYDAVGNRTSVTTTRGTNNTVIPYLANNCNQYTKVGSLLVSSDRNGNLTSDENGTTYSYDAQNRLIAVTTKTGTTMSVAYDAQNRVVSRTINGVTTYYAYDGWNLIEELDASGNALARYIHGPQADEMLARINPSGTVYYIQDGNQNVTALTDESGAVKERYSYDVYGTPSIFNASGLSLQVSGFQNRFLFTGREFISQIGLYDYRNRVYSPGLGRFLQTDPIRFDAGDVNIYRYVGNNPVNWVDPWGLDVIGKYQNGNASIDTDGDKRYNKRGTDGKFPDKNHRDDTSLGEAYDPSIPGVVAPYEVHTKKGSKAWIKVGCRWVQAIVFDKIGPDDPSHKDQPEFNVAAAEALGLGVQNGGEDGPYPYEKGDKNHDEVYTEIFFE
jgi:RHS repeat-associated protein